MNTMRPYQLSLLLLMFANGDLFATDRVVSVTGTYNTISSAVAASADGDRILVEPGVYNESITLSKSISLHPNVEGGRYTLNGGLLLNAVDGRTITVSGMRILEGLSMTGALTTLTTVRIVDSYVPAIDLVDPFVRLEMYRDTVLARVRFSAGHVIGSTIIGTSFSGSGVVELVGPTALSGNVQIIGNKIGQPAVQAGVYGVFVNSKTVWHIENNFVQVRDIGSAIGLALPAHPYTTACTIDNNTLFTDSSTPPGPSGFATAVDPFGSTAFNLSTANNAYVGFPDGWIVTTPGWDELRQSSNLACLAGNIDTSSGGALPGSTLIDAGDPDPRYLDLDLTRNDVGCYGGSNSRANFTTAMGSAVVGFMQAPRVVTQGDPVNISATGFDR